MNSQGRKVDSQIIFGMANNFVEHKIQKERIKVSARQEKKFVSIERKKISRKNFPSARCFKNLTSGKVPEDVRHVSQLGLKFCLPSLQLLL